MASLIASLAAWRIHITLPNCASVNESLIGYFWVFSSVSTLGEARGTNMWAKYQRKTSFSFYFRTKVSFRKAKRYVGAMGTSTLLFCFSSGCSWAGRVFFTWVLCSWLCLPWSVSSPTCLNNGCEREDVRWLKEEGWRKKADGRRKMEKGRWMMEEERKKRDDYQIMRTPGTGDRLAADESG